MTKIKFVVFSVPVKKFENGTRPLKSNSVLLYISVKYNQNPKVPQMIIFANRK